jgi:SAM-dependent methyltransferase
LRQERVRLALTSPGKRLPASVPPLGRVVPSPAWQGLNRGKGEESAVKSFATQGATDVRVREAEEIRRSAEDAKKVDVEGYEINRYLRTSRDTAYSLEYAFWLLGDVRGKLVVDLGCGAGENSAVLAALGARVIGLDLSPHLLEIARKRVSGAEFREASALETGIPSGSVDVVFGIAILHHLPLDQARDEVFRILRPGGIGIFQEPVQNSRLMAFLRRCIPIQTGEVSAFERPFRDAELDGFCARFALVAQRRFRLPFVKLCKIMLPRLSSLAHRTDRLLLKIGSMNHFATVRVFKVAKPIN